MFSHLCIDDLTLASSSSVPAPAEVSAGGTAGTMASGFEEIRCSCSLTNSECVRRTSRNWVVRNLGKLVCISQYTALETKESSIRRHQTSEQDLSFLFVQAPSPLPGACTVEPVSAGAHCDIALLQVVAVAHLVEQHVEHADVARVMPAPAVVVACCPELVSRALVAHCNPQLKNLESPALALADSLVLR